MNTLAIILAACLLGLFLRYQLRKERLRKFLEEPEWLGYGYRSRFYWLNKHTQITTLKNAGESRTACGVRHRHNCIDALEDL